MSDQSASSNDEVVPSGGRLPHGAEPGASSVPNEPTGAREGGVQGRVEPGAGPPPGSNQGKVEPLPPTPGHAEPDASVRGTPQRPEPSSGAMSSTNAQSPSAGGLTGPLAAAAAPGRDIAMAAGTTFGADATARTEGAEPREGEAYRAPQQQGSGGPAALANDTVSGAARTQPGAPPASAAPARQASGDPQGVSANHPEPMEGTSEESNVVHGVRTVAIAPPGSADGEVDTRR